VKSLEKRASCKDRCPWNQRVRLNLILDRHGFESLSGGSCVRTEEGDGLFCRVLTQRLEGNIDERESVEKNEKYVQHQAGIGIILVSLFFDQRDGADGEEKAQT
jgi:hypothetical protein